MMISQFGPIWANCLIPSPNLEPIPAAMIISVVFIDFIFLYFFFAQLFYFILSMPHTVLRKSIKSSFINIKAAVITVNKYAKKPIIDSNSYP